MGKKLVFSKVAPRSYGMPTQLNCHFDPVVALLGPTKITNCLENGPTCDKWDQQWLKNLYINIYFSTMCVARMARSKPISMSSDVKPPEMTTKVYIRGSYFCYTLLHTNMPQVSKQTSK